MDRSDKCWLVVGMFGLLCAALLQLLGLDPDARQQPRSEGSGLFSRDEPVMDPLDSGLISRQNQQQSGK